MKISRGDSTHRRTVRGAVVRSAIAGSVFASVAAIFAPLSAQAQMVTKDGPFSAPVTYQGNFIRSWLDMVSATQAAQPNWMTPLVTVTPRLEQEFRWDVYDQKNGSGTQGNGQTLVNYGGPGGARIELIPAYNWEVILAAPRTCRLQVRRGPEQAQAIGRPSWSNIVFSPPTRTMAITS
jgi:hypothetical protein